jgi:hypothetical protein
LMLNVPPDINAFLDTNGRVVYNVLIRVEIFKVYFY